MSGSQTDIGTAFEMLIESIGAEVHHLRESGARALSNGEYVVAQSVIQKATRMETFLSETKRLRNRWINESEAETEPEDDDEPESDDDEEDDDDEEAYDVADEADENEVAEDEVDEDVADEEEDGDDEAYEDDTDEEDSEEDEVEPHSEQRSETTDDYFKKYHIVKFAILSILSARGGSAKASDVMGSVEAELRSKLEASYFESDRITPDIPRWQMLVYRVRQVAQGEGFIRSDGAKGIWHLTEKGKKHIDSQDVDLHGEGRANEGPVLEEVSSQEQPEAPIAPTAHSDDEPPDDSLEYHRFSKVMLSELALENTYVDLFTLLERIEKAISPTLTKEERAPVSDDVTTPRWHESAARVREELETWGLITSNSSPGKWRITSRGRRALAAWTDEEESDPPG